MSILDIFNSGKPNQFLNWEIVNDAVMGGKSFATFNLNEQTNGVFQGNVSLENNGGFSLVRCRFKKIDISKYKTIKLHVKGDGKKYQFRVKPSLNCDHSYITLITTNKKWQTFEIELASLEPLFRGRKLNSSNFSYGTLEEVAFLCGNKKSESFNLVINSINLI